MAKRLSAKQQYIKLSSVARSRLKEIEKRNPNARVLERWKNQFPTYTQLKEEGITSKGLNLILKELKGALGGGELSLRSSTRAKAGALRTFQEMGYDYIDNENFDYFIKFLDDMRARDLGAIYSSSQMISAIDSMVEKKLTKDEILGNIDYWSRQLKYDENGRLIETSRPSLKVDENRKMSSRKFARATTSGSFRNR